MFWYAYFSLNKHILSVEHIKGLQIDVMTNIHCFEWFIQKYQICLYFNFTASHPSLYMHFTRLYQRISFTSIYVYWNNTTCNVVGRTGGLWGTGYDRPQNVCLIFSHQINDTRGTKQYLQKKHSFYSILVKQTNNN